MSSSAQMKGSNGASAGEHRRGPRRSFTDEERMAVLDAYAKTNDESPITIHAWCKAQAINTSQFYQWRRKLKLKRGKALRLARKPQQPKPDHERDINQLAVLNAATVHAAHIIPAMGSGDSVFDERLGTVLGATIAEIIKRLR